MAYWAMRTSRDTSQSRNFVTEELSRGRLRQGWGYDPTQDLRCIHEAWRENEELTREQKDASRHWRMADGEDREADEYMNIGDIVLVPNMPSDGLFTLCRITGDYDFKSRPRLATSVTSVRWRCLRHMVWQTNTNWSTLDFAAA